MRQLCAALSPVLGKLSEQRGKLHNLVPSLCILGIMGGLHLRRPCTRLALSACPSVAVRD